MPVVQKEQMRRKRKYGTEVIAFTARISKDAYASVQAYADESKQSIGLALEELIQRAVEKVCNRKEENEPNKVKE